MRSLKGYRARVALIPFLLIGYVAAALFVPHRGSAEFYPFFNWSLFSFASSDRGDIVLLIRRVGDENFDPPRTFFEMTDTFAAARSESGGFPKLLDDFVLAQGAGDAETMAKLRNVIETTFLREARSVRYDLAIIRYDPINRYRTRAIDEVQVLASFEKASQ